MDDSRLQFGCQICSVVLVVRCRSIRKCPIFCSFADTEFRSDKIRNFLSCPWLLNKSYGFRKFFCDVLYRMQKINFAR